MASDAALTNVSQTVAPDFPVLASRELVTASERPSETLEGCLCRLGLTSPELLYWFPVQLSTESRMAIETSYTDARANLAHLLDRVTQDREIVVINRRGHEDVAMVAASELSSLIETAYLLRSPKNAQRLLEALHRSLANEDRPSSVEELRREFGLDRED